MLERLGRKAQERGLAIETVLGPADRPPAGPFDAVIERHLLWTLPDPAGTLARWREVAPGGRLVLYEGSWGRSGAARRLRGRVADAARSVLSVAPDHHGEYDEDLVASLPLAGGMAPETLVRVATQAGWRAPRIERLRDIEWANARSSHPVLGRIESVPRFALIADA